MTAARDDLAARGVRVKPLEWADFDGLGAKASGFYQANYLIQKWSGEGRYEVAMSYPGYQTGYDGLRWHSTLEAAKAAAQADYEARILAALEVTPEALSDHPAVKALVAEAETRVMRIAAGLFPGGYTNNLTKIAEAATIRKGETP